MYKCIFPFLFFLTGFLCQAQQVSLSGKVSAGGSPVPFAHIFLEGPAKAVAADSTGNYYIGELTAGRHVFKVSALGYKTQTRSVMLQPGQQNRINIEMAAEDLQMNEVVVTGTLREVNRMET